jgi:hypothetical protein
MENEFTGYEDTNKDSDAAAETSATDVTFFIPLPLQADLCNNGKNW